MPLRAEDLAFCPTLTEAGQRMLDFLREHPAAPRYTNQSGHRLLADEVQALRGFVDEVKTARVGWPGDGVPDWLPDFVAQTCREVPAYRELPTLSGGFTSLPTTRRADLATDIARYVPDPVPLDRMINFRTTGTTGTPLLIASHPVVASRYLAFHLRALRRAGIEPRHGRGQVGVVLLGVQKRCFTYVSVTPLMDESGLAKINLHPDDWRHPDDRTAYLDALDAEVIAGDPLSFGELLTLPLRTRPRALLSVGMTLSPGLRETLQQRFGCPVLDLYSMNEAGPIAVYDEALRGHLLLQPRLYVEILDAQGRPVPEGARGEITLTGGFNFCLPLLRYRTGDHAALEHTDEGPVLKGLMGRAPVRFRSAGGDWINNIDVTHALAPWPLTQYALHQGNDGALRLRLTPAALHHGPALTAALAHLLGPLPVTVEPLHADDKVLQYTSDLEACGP
ncbi:AMP-binding protein [Roseateles terrae]|nr:AMP-binding protein [Roseateles terrae]OWQ83746.1 capsule biosynthesis protein CapK [Roseateles terrae]